MFYLLSFVVIVLAGRVWWRRVPFQNLAQAHFTVAVCGWGLWGLLATSLALPASLAGPFVAVAAAAIPSLRLGAAFLLRPWRTARSYGLGLNLLAALGTTLVLALFLGAQGAPVGRPWWVVGVLFAWSFGVLLLTLPCWLDKLRDGPGRLPPAG